jgi:hypothetical protein
VAERHEDVLGDVLGPARLAIAQRQTVDVVPVTPIEQIDARGNVVVDRCSLEDLRGDLAHRSLHCHARPSITPMRQESRAQTSSPLIT